MTDLHLKSKRPNHLSLTDEEFLTQFADCSLNPKMFSHEAHIRLAWLQVNQYGVDAAKSNITYQLKAYADHLKVKLYHVTITIMAVQAVADFIEKDKKTSSPTKNFLAFIAKYPELINDFKQVINTYYSFDIFSHATAKTEFIVPDFHQPV